MTLLVAGCAADPSKDDVGSSTAVEGTALLDGVNETQERARIAALTAGRTALGALGVAEVEGGSRASRCTDAVGAETDEWYGEYSSGASLAADSISAAQLDQLVAGLGSEPLEDSLDSDGRRMVAYVVPVDGVDVVVRVGRSPDGSATVTASTPCID